MFDTNVLVSGLNFSGNEHAAIQLARQGRFELFLSPFILEELTGVLVRKFAWSQSDASSAAALFAQLAEVIDPPRTTFELADNSADTRVLDCASAASADYLVTGDRRHLLPLGSFGGTSVLSAADFLVLFSS